MLYRTVGARFFLAAFVLAVFLGRSHREHTGSFYSRYEPELLIYVFCAFFFAQYSFIFAERAAFAVAAVLRARVADSVCRSFAHLAR